MRNLGRDARASPDLDEFGHAGHHVVGLVAHVAFVQPAQGRQPPGHLHQFVGARIDARGVDQPAGHAHGALGHAPGGQLAHGGQLRGARGLVRKAHDRDAQRAVAHEADHVGAQGQGLQVREPLGEAAPGPRRLDPGLEEAGVGVQQGEVFVADRGGAVAAVADGLGRHALAQLARGVGAAQQVEVRVGVHVDEARSQIAVLGVHDLGGRQGRGFGAHGHDAPAPGGHRAPEPGRAQAVDDARVGDEQVGLHDALLLDVTRRRRPAARAPGSAASRTGPGCTWSAAARECPPRAGSAA